MLRAAYFTLYIVAFLFLVGCSGPGLPPLVNVKGKVTLANGQPVQNVRIEFYPVEGGAPAAGVVDESGGFTLKTNDTSTGIAVGKYKVSFGPHGADKAEVDRSNKMIKKIPLKYYDDDSSNLVVEITPGQTNLSIKLDAKQIRN